MMNTSAFLQNLPLTAKAGIPLSVYADSGEDDLVLTGNSFAYFYAEYKYNIMQGFSELKTGNKNGMAGKVITPITVLSF